VPKLSESVIYPSGNDTMTMHVLLHEGLPIPKQRTAQFSRIAPAFGLVHLPCSPFRSAKTLHVVLLNHIERSLLVLESTYLAPFCPCSSWPNPPNPMKRNLRTQLAQQQLFRRFGSSILFGQATWPGLWRGYLWNLIWIYVWSIFKFLFKLYRFIVFVCLCFFTWRTIRSGIDFQRECRYK